MAKYASTWTSVSMVATANGTLTANNYVCLQGGSATQQIKVSEVYMGGEAASTSAPSIMVLSRTATASAVTLAAGTGLNSTVLTDATATAPSSVPTFGQTAGTQATRAATHLLHLSFNAYGGIVRWVASPDQTISMYGNAFGNGELTLSAYTGSTTAPVSGHFLYEVV